MTKYRNTLLRVGAACLVLAIPAAPAFAAAERVALVIGNAGYEREEDRLANPVNDARAISNMLEALDFHVVRALDASQRDFYYKLEEFERASVQAEVALLFYAGHGLQWEGENYLIPTDITVRKTGDLKRTISLTEAMSHLHSEKNIVLLDACRDTVMLEDLVLKRGLTRSAIKRYRGLSPVNLDPAEGKHTLIFYATTPGKSALDGAGEHSPFTAALLMHMPTPNVALHEVVINVTEHVRNTTQAEFGEAQVPWASGAFSVKFAFIGDPSKQDVPSEPQPPTPQEQDRAFYESIRDSKDPSEIQVYLTKFSDGDYVNPARGRLSAAIQESVHPAVLRFFVENHPTSEFAPLANERLLALEAQSPVAAVSPKPGSSGSPDENLGIVISPSGSTGQTVALSAMGPDEAAFARAKASGTVQAYAEYMSIFGEEGRYYEEAQRRKKTLLWAATGLPSWENKAWAPCRKTKSRVDCEIYLEAFPGGSYRRRAEKFLAALQ